MMRCLRRFLPLMLGAACMALSVVPAAVAQSGQWTYWFGYQGGAAPNATFGIKGVASPNNNPGWREGAVTWTDASGNLWLFGGYGDSSNYEGYLDDLWMWNVSTKEWTWEAGNSADSPPNYGTAGAYGTRGIPGATNMPGSRVGALSWVDSSGKLWMFGGNGLDSAATPGNLSDLWRYDPATQLWTWIGGSTTVPRALLGAAGVYGTKGTAAAGNIPGGRSSSATWTDAAGDFWLFGGTGADSTGPGDALLNDLWMYNPTTGLWTWEGGSNVAGAAGSNGPAGIALSSNIPEARTGAFAWTDKQHNFWMFGGSTGSTVGALNDLWEYSTSTGLWTYYNGSQTAGAAGSYGTQGVASSTNQPPGRANGSAWSDTNGNLWLYGGNTINLNSNYDDLWVYQPASNEWTWIGGSQTQQDGGSYPAVGTASTTSYPGARSSQMTWVDLSGNAWIFAGWNSEPYNNMTNVATLVWWDDLWSYSIPSLKAPAVTASPIALSFSTAAGVASPSQTVTLTNGGTSSVSISSVVVTGAGAGAYQIADHCVATLVPGAQCTVGVVLSTNSAASASAQLVFTDSDPSSPQVVRLAGNALAATTTVLGTATPTITSDAMAMLRVSVAESSGTAVPTGTVTLLQGATTIATLTLNGTGYASYTLPQLAAGTYTYTANYQGDSANAVSSSSVLTLTSIAPPATSALSWAWVNGLSAPDTSYTNQAYWPTDPAGEGVASPSNYPGYRNGALTWADRNGNLWLWGGGSNNDLWKLTTSTGAWTYLGGNNIGNSQGPERGTYGVQGLPAASNIPGYRSGALRWIDSNGNLWLFGGSGPDSASAYGALNDLWMYNVTTNLWTWVSGSSTAAQAGVYGTKGTAAVANVPGGRYNAQSWVDPSGNFWLFSGLGEDSTGNQGNLVDIWMFNPTTKQWTWEAGPNTGQFNGETYTAQGLPAAGNIPSVKTNAMTWVDGNGNFWMFGGAGIPLTAPNETYGDLNDLWMFNPTTKLWTFEGGAQTVNAPGTYGTLGTGSSNNIPPARESGATFTDASGNFWLFGGSQTTNNNNVITVAPLNDLWMFNPSQAVWTWVAGSNTTGNVGTYGTQGTARAANIPSARQLAAAWTDNSGNFWLLGGTAETTTSGLPLLNDLWMTTSAAATGTATVTLNPAGPLSFTTPSGSSAATQTVTLTNNGTAALTGISFGLSYALGIFPLASNCPSSLGAGATCTFTIGFTPNAVGTYSTALTITDSASNSPQSIAITGTATGTLAPVATIYPTSLIFAPTLVNTTNSGQSVTLDNSGTAPLTGITASITGTNASAFAVSSAPCGTLTLGASCVILVTFTPPSTGTFNATLTIADNAGNSPQTVPLSGTGTGATELASVGPSFVGFANQTVSSTSAAVTVTLANAGTTALTGISPAISGAGASAFAISATTCGTSLAAAANCNVSITFTPGSVATFNATLTVADNSSNGPHLVPLSGTGVPASATTAVTLSTTSLTFPNTAIGGSAPLPVTLTNSGTQPVLIEGIMFGDTHNEELNSLSASENAFTQTSTCGTTLAVGASCVITVTFSPTAGSLYSGTLLIADTSSSLAQSVSLTGVGTGGPGTSAALSPALSFATVPVNTTSAPQISTLTNTGSTTLTGITPSISSGSAFGFAVSGTTCGSSLAAGATCAISVTYTPTASYGVVGANLNVADSAASSPQTIILAGSPTCSFTTGTSCNPGGSSVFTSTLGLTLAFEPPTVTTATATAASTEIVAKYQGTVVYDQTFPAAYGTPAVQSGVTAANAAIVTAGGSTAVIPAPVLTSTGTSTSTASTSVYSRDPAAPVNSTGASTTFGPATIQGYFALSNQTGGQLTECLEASLPSSTLPTCYATDPGIFVVESGQTDINVNTTLTYFIDTATTATTTTTTATIYSISGAAPTAPAVTLTPAGPLSFTSSGQTTAAQTLTINNSGTAPLSISGVSITGANAGSFTQSNTCTSPIAAGSNCTVTVTFTPAVTGASSATLLITDNASGSPQMIQLSGLDSCVNNPATPYVNCNPGASTVVTGSRTEHLTFAPATTTSATANAYSTEIVGKFNSTTVYDQTFAAAYGSPTVQAGITAANAAVAAAGGSGTTVPSPIQTASSTSATTVSASTYSIAQPASSTTVTTVTSTLSVGPGTIIAAVGTGNPANPLAGQASQCSEASLPSTTMPTCAATNGGTFTINTGQTDVNTNIDSNYLVNTATTTTTTNTTASSYTISATGAPAVSLTPTGPLAFTSASGTTSAAQIVTISNTGTAVLSLTSITLTGTNAASFARSTTCGVTLAAGSSCPVSITFSPAATGSFTAALLISDNAAGSPQTVTLIGTATSATPATFTFSVANASQSTLPGSPVTYNITATAQNGTLPGPISLSASGLPQGVTSVFSPASISPGSGLATSQLTLQIPASFAALHDPAPHRYWVYAGLFPFFGLGLAALRRRRRWLALLTITLSVAVFNLSGCGGGFGVAPAQTYTITVTGTSSSQTVSTTVALTIL